MKSKSKKIKKAIAKTTSQDTTGALTSKLKELYKIARDLHQKNNFLDAEKQYKKLIKLDPNDALALADLGTLYIQTNRLDEAEAYLNKSISINPN